MTVHHRSALAASAERTTTTVRSVRSDALGASAERST